MRVLLTNTTSFTQHVNTHVTVDTEATQEQDELRNWNSTQTSSAVVNRLSQRIGHQITYAWCRVCRARIVCSGDDANTARGRAAGKLSASRPTTLATAVDVMEFIESRANAMGPRRDCGRVSDGLRSSSNRSKAHSNKSHLTHPQYTSFSFSPLPHKRVV